MRRIRACACLALAAALAGCAAGEGSRGLYQWTDAGGNVRYTAFPDDVPGGQQHTVELVQPSAFAQRSAPPAQPIDVAAARPASQPPATEPPAAGIPPAELPAPSPPTATGAPPAAAPAAPPAAAPAPEPIASAVPPAEASLDARIAELEARIAAEQETLKALISDPAAAPELRGSSELRAIGERLPALQSELEALRSQRAEAAKGDGG